MSDYRRGYADALDAATFEASAILESLANPDEIGIAVYIERRIRTLPVPDAPDGWRNPNGGVPVGPDPFLAVDRDGYIAIVYFRVGEDGDDLVEQGTGEVFEGLVGWMPLPAPPAPEGK